MRMKVLFAKQFEVFSPLDLNENVPMGHIWTTKAQISLHI